MEKIDLYILIIVKITLLISLTLFMFGLFTYLFGRLFRHFQIYILIIDYFFFKKKYIDLKNKKLNLIILADIKEYLPLLDKEEISNSKFAEILNDKARERILNKR